MRLTHEAGGCAKEIEEGLSDRPQMYLMQKGSMEQDRGQHSLRRFLRTDRAASACSLKSLSKGIY